MSLKFAILALLSEKERSGYDIAKTFKGSVGYFWQATHQQIYRDLAALERDRLVKFKEVEQAKSPAKKNYALTKKGLSLLKNWLQAETPTPVVKVELLIKLFCIQLLDPEEFLQELARITAMHRENLESYRAIECKYFSRPKELSRKLRFQYLTLQRGIIYERGWIEWLELASLTLQHDC